MSERFETWPHDAEGIVREALREYVGDGDGEDEKVLTAYLDQVRAVARREGQAEAWEAGAQAQAATYGMDKDTGPNPYLEDRHVDN